MTGHFTPLTRRVLALGFAVLAILLTTSLVILPLFSYTSNSLADLEDARFRLARLEAIRAWPASTDTQSLPPSVQLAAIDEEAASRLLAERIHVVAVQSGLEPAALRLAEQPGEGEKVSLAVSIQGEQNQILSFINMLEKGQPIVRFSAWALAGNNRGLSSGTEAPVVLQFDGVATAAWEPSL